MKSSFSIFPPKKLGGAQRGYYCKKPKDPWSWDSFFMDWTVHPLVYQHWHFAHGHVALVEGLTLFLPIISMEYSSNAALFYSFKLLFILLLHCVHISTCALTMPVSTDVIVCSPCLILFALLSRALCLNLLNIDACWWRWRSTGGSACRCRRGADPV